MDAAAPGLTRHRGFGSREGRAPCVSSIEVDSRFITLAALHELFVDGKVERSASTKPSRTGINTDKPIQ